MPLLHVTALDFVTLPMLEFQAEQTKKILNVVGAGGNNTRRESWAFKLNLTIRIS